MSVNPFSAIVYGAVISAGGVLWANGQALAALWGWPLAGAALLLGYTALIVFAGCFYRYEVLLGEGGKAEETSERKDYDALRNALQSGGGPVRIYTDWLTRFLGAVDRFFGDKNVVTRGRAARLFGLPTQAPIWTAPAYDRCLLLALFYPVATIFLIWVISGHVGPAEAALGLERDTEGWRRGLALIAVMTMIIAFWQATVKEGYLSFIWLGVAVAVAVHYAFVFAGAGAVAFAGAVAGAGAGAVAFAVAFAGAVAFAVAFAGAVAFAVAGAVAVLSIVLLMSHRSKARGWQHVFLLLFTLVMGATCLAAPYFLSTQDGWLITGPLLLFLGLLTLINAPFDWLSLGLTRGLLRLGIERGGWWPYLLALIDAVAAVAVIAVLSCAMIIGIQAFDYLAVLGGGTPVLPLHEVFDGIGANPHAPEYWWIYALLLSTMIPSLINLAIGGTALVRGIPGLGPMLLRLMPAGQAVPAHNRPVLALALTGQWGAGIALGVAAQFILLWFIVGRFLPWIGFGLLDLARGIEVFNLPFRVHQLF